MSWAVLFVNIDRTAFNGDESGWIASGGYYTELVLSRDFDREKWACSECSGWGSLNLHLGKWLVGIPQTFDGRARGRRFFRFYEFDQSLEENILQGRVPPRDVLRRARSVSVVFGVLCGLLVFTIGHVSFNVYVGALAAYLVVTSDLFISVATRAMTDVHFSFFLLSLCLAVVLLSRCTSSNQSGPLRSCRKRHFPPLCRVVRHPQILSSSCL